MNDIQTLVEVRDALHVLLRDGESGPQRGLIAAVKEVSRMLEVGLVARDKWLEQQDQSRASFIHAEQERREAEKRFADLQYIPPVLEEDEA